MEEEYRMQKAQSEHLTSSSSAVIHEDGSVTLDGQHLSSQDADDNASTKGVRSAPHSPNPSQLNGTDIPNGIPTIRISTESQREAKKEETDTEQPETNGIHDDAEAPKQAATSSLEKPVQAAAGEGKGNDEPSGPSPSQSEAFSFSNKRLCERWLDNLFMVLYEVSYTSSY